MDFIKKTRMKKIKTAILLNSIFCLVAFMILLKVAGTGVTWKIVFASVGFIGSLGLTLACVIKFNKIRNERL